MDPFVRFKWAFALNVIVVIVLSVVGFLTHSNWLMPVVPVVAVAGTAVMAFTLRNVPKA